VLVEMLDDVLAPFRPASRRHARETLVERGVEVRTGTQVARVRATRVAFADGEELAAHTLVWAAGVQANPLGRALGLETGRAGRIVVGADLQVPDRPGVWAIGDVAAIESGGGRGELLPQLAPVAMQSGRFVGAQIAAVAQGRPAPAGRFRYRDKGTMATIGRSRAVAELPLGIELRGFTAWLSWLGLHLVMLAGFRNRISVFANWAWNWLTYDRGPRLIFPARPRARPGRSG
jgi:NADH dehydrogenase